MNNSISGSDAFSYVYGRDGAAVEVYGGLDNNVHDNLGVDNNAFSELGNSRSRGNTYSYNVVRSSLATSTSIVTRGSLDGFGPVANTRLLNNTVVMTGSSSQGFVCYAGCNSSILLRSRCVGKLYEVRWRERRTLRGSNTLGRAPA